MRPESETTSPYLLGYGQGLLVNDSWPCVWHCSNESDASSQSSRCARVEVLLVGLARVPHVDVGINEIRETDDAVGRDTVHVGLLPSVE